MRRFFSCHGPTPPLKRPRRSSTARAGLPARRHEPAAATIARRLIRRPQLVFPLSTDPADLDAPPWRATARHALSSRPPACARLDVARPTIRQTGLAARAPRCGRSLAERADRTRLPIFQLPLTCGGPLPARLVSLPRQLPAANTTGRTLHSQLAAPDAQTSRPPL